MHHNKHLILKSARLLPRTRVPCYELQQFFVLMLNRQSRVGEPRLGCHTKLKHLSALDSKHRKKARKEPCQGQFVEIVGVNPTHRLSARWVHVLVVSSHNVSGTYCVSGDGPRPRVAPRPRFTQRPKRFRVWTSLLERQSARQGPPSAPEPCC